MIESHPLKGFCLPPLRAFWWLRPPKQPPHHLSPAACWKAGFRVIGLSGLVSNCLLEHQKCPVIVFFFQCWINGWKKVGICAALLAIFPPFFLVTACGTGSTGSEPLAWGQIWSGRAALEPIHPQVRFLSAPPCYRLDGCREILMLNFLKLY